jgi:diguanylate cyclase (GGDEF)-like protein
MQAVVPEHNHELLLLELERQYTQLQTRRQLRDAQTRLAWLQQRCHQLMDDSPLAICLLHRGLICHANRSFAHLFGYRDAEHLREHPMRQLLEERCRSDLDQTLRECDHSGCELQRTLTAMRPDDTCFEARFCFAPTEYDDAPCLEVKIITEFDESDQISHEINPISGLSNHQAFMRALESARNNARHGGQDRGLMLLTLNQLEVTRAKLGADGVDLILRDTATILKQKMGRDHLLFHLDDNSFAIILQTADPDETVKIGWRLCRAVSGHTCPVQEMAIHATLSVGIVAVNDCAPRAAELLSRARRAAENRQHGDHLDNSVTLYQHKKMRLWLYGNDAKMSKHLHDALKKDHFHLLYQPVVPLRLETPTQYYEVLLRLVSDSDEEISPYAFIAQAIEPEVLVELDRWVIGRALAALGRGPHTHNRTHLFINLSGPSLCSTELEQWLGETLRQGQVPGEYLVFEISESSAAIDLPAAHRFVRAVRQSGCQICLKHFGSSPSSERVRKELDCEFIKLDGSYIQDLQNRTLTAASLEAILAPLKQRHKLIIAPLVEETHVISDLFSAGVDLIQGHYLQPPQPSMDYDFFEG